VSRIEEQSIHLQELETKNGHSLLASLWSHFYLFASFVSIDQANHSVFWSNREEE